MKYLLSVVLAASVLALVAGCPSPQKSPPQPVGIQPQPQPESQPQVQTQTQTPETTGQQPARSAKEEIVGSLTGSLERLDQRLTSFRNSKPAAEDLKQAEQLLAEARAALQEANASTDEGEELLRKVHAVNTALFNLDQFLSSKGQ